MRDPYDTAPSQEWKQARRAAFVQDILGAFTKRPAGLLSFYQVSQKLKLSNMQPLGLQEVPLEQIVGSVGRYTDFTRAFLPREDHLQERWQRAEQLVRGGYPLPPVQLYKVGQVYFVSDGHHRVSVARQHGQPTIKARVWEYDTPVPLEPDSDVDELLCRAAHAAFLAQTKIDQLRPDVDVRLTRAGGYDELLHEIQTYQRILSEVDRREISLDEAVDLWCDLRYTPIVGLIRERYALADFPGRTEADLYLWLCRNRDELESHYEEHVLIDEAAVDLSKRYGENPLPVRQIRRAAAWLAAAARRLARQEIS
jgi:hypothetical protein